MSKTLLNKIILYGIIAVIAIGTCLGIWSLVSQHSNKDNNKLVVYTSMYPLQDFVQKVGGNKVTAKSIVPAGVDAHDYQGPSAKLVAQMEEADLILVIGAGMESWLDSLSSNSRIQQKLLITSSRATLLDRNGHSHNDEESEHEEDDHGHSHGQYDPHVWLSVTNAKIMVEDIKNKLSEIDPQNFSYYQRRYNEYILSLNGLSLQYDAVLQSVSKTSFVVSHRAFGYIAEEYGLTQISLTSIMSTGDVSGSSIQNAINYISNNNIKVIFYTSNEDPQIVNSIAEQTKIISDSLSAIELLTKEETTLGYDYVGLMYKNLAALQVALA